MPSTFCMVLNGTSDMSARRAFVRPSCFFRSLISERVIDITAVTSCVYGCKLLETEEHIRVLRLIWRIMDLIRNYDLNLIPL